MSSTTLFFNQLLVQGSAKPSANREIPGIHLIVHRHLLTNIRLSVVLLEWKFQETPMMQLSAVNKRYDRYFLPLVADVTSFSRCKHEVD